MQRVVWAVLGIVLLAIGPIGVVHSAPPASSGTAAAGQGAGQAAGAAAISGVVSDEVTGRPIAGASVFLVTRDRASGQLQPLRLSMVTDARGRFVFLEASPKYAYTLSATHGGYEAGQYEGPNAPAGTRSERGASITVRDGEWLRDANILMRPVRPSSIGGRVVDERGEPVVAAAVRLFTTREVSGHDQLMPGSVTSTDDRGVYRVPVTAGRYYVAVLSVQATMPVSAADRPRDLALGGLVAFGRSAPPIDAGAVRGPGIDVDGRHRLVLSNFATPPPPGAGRPRAYAPVFFPAARDIGSAQAVEIEAGTTRADIDFRLEPVDAVTVSGRVTGQADAAVNMFLRLMRPGSEHLGFGSEVATTIVEPDGTFTFLRVPTGRYTLLASPAIVEAGSGGEGKLPPSVGYGSVQGLSRTYPGGAPSRMWWRSSAGAAVWGRMPVDVGAGDVADLDLPLHGTTTVRGRLVFDGPDPPDPNRRVNLMLEPANGDATLGVPNGWTDAGDDTYAFVAEGLQSGRYVPRIGFPRDWRVKSITAGGADLTATGFDGSIGTDFDDVVVTMTREGASLSGRVTDARGGMATGTVLLFPTDRAQWADYGLTPERLLSIGADADGAYAFTGVPDGEYYAIAVSGRQTRDWMETRFLDAAAALATRVSLVTGRTQTQDLRMSEVIVR
ncbi:MAG: carboxypeptidase regulatory-like domain-containing protein [Vicinamibacterales bacterium]